MHDEMRRLYAACAELGADGPTQVARLLKAGVSTQTVKNWEKRGISEGGKILLSKVLGMNLRHIESGAQPVFYARPNSPTLPTQNAEQTTVPTLAGPSPVPAPGEAGIPVAILSNAASMGGGADALSEDVLCGQISLSPTFVHDYIRPTRADALRFLHSYGDSMHPTFNSGDVLLVDTGVREPRIDGVYVLAAHGRLFIKRVRQRMDGSMEVSSDNPCHKTVDTLNGDHTIDVLGRVVWCWNGRKV